MAQTADNLSHCGPSMAFVLKHGPLFDLMRRTNQHLVVDNVRVEL
jgi:hypothetical protein